MLKKYVNRENQCCGRRWCVSDGCGITCAILTWLLMLYGQFCVVAVMAASMSMSSDSGIIAHQLINLLVFETLFVLSIGAHLKTMLTDPGAVRKGTLTEERALQAELEQQQGGTVIYKCTKCACIKPERAHHCSVCNRCIRRMDHHCPWVNNCVGETNQKSFVLFTMYISLLSFQVLYWAIWQFVLCVNDDWHSCSYFGPAATAILLVFLLFESILFAIFTAVMFGTQISAICSDQTGIESLKRELHNERRKTERWKNLQVVFGGPFSWNWFNPMLLPFVSEKSFEFSV